MGAGSGKGEVLHFPPVSSREALGNMKVSDKAVFVCFRMCNVIPSSYLLWNFQ